MQRHPAPLWRRRLGSGLHRCRRVIASVPPCAVTLIRRQFAPHRCGARPTQRQQPRRRGGDHRKHAGAQKDLRWRHFQRQQITAQHGRSDAAEAANAERPAEAAGAHARRVELAAGRVGAGLAADDRHPAKEDDGKQDRVRQHDQRDHRDEDGADRIVKGQRPFGTDAVDQRAEV